MPWIAITPDDLARACAGPELNALKNAALWPGAQDPVPLTIADAIAEVRAAVTSCTTNTMGPAGTVPASLSSATIAIAIYSALSRLPVSSLITEARTRLFDVAQDKLKRVSTCSLSVDPPEESTQVAANNVPHWRAPRARFTQRTEDGL